MKGLLDSDIDESIKKVAPYVEGAIALIKNRALPYYEEISLRFGVSVAPPSSND